MWRFNNKALNDEMFTSHLKEVILGVQRVYNYMDATELWELVKSYCIKECKIYGKKCAREDRLYRCNLYKTLEILQEDIFNEQGNIDNLEYSIRNVSAAIDSSLEKEAEKAAFMSKARFIKDGERNSKYFFGMGKRNYVHKTIYKIRKADGTLTKDYREILQVQSDFYANLYSSNPQVQFDITNQSGIFLSEFDKNRLDMPITVTEIYDALVSMKSDKAPGLDGLTKEFFVKLFPVLKEPLYRMYMASIRNGTLNPTARKGVIQLLPKPRKSELEICNFRPLTLLNYDYKILARVLAIRMDSVMPDLIGNQQNGFMKGRNIAHNILRTKEILAYTRKNKKAGVIISIDFEKCFDRVEYTAIRGSLRYFNFGEQFIRYIFLLFKDFSFCTKNNGYFSDFQSKTRGVNQGCPASPGIYNLSGEIMAHLLQNNPNIKGISVNGVLNLLSQFADDTNIFTKFEQVSVESICDTLKRVECNIGLKISYEKTSLYRIGSLIKSDARLYTTQNLKWTDGPIDMLGVQLATDGSMVPANFEKILSKVRSACDNWYNKTSTLSGKILILNSLVGSLFVYQMGTMIDITEDQIKVVEKEIYKFLWGGKRARISIKTLYADKLQGGLRLVNLRAKQKALKLKWIFSIDQDNFLRTCMYEALDPRFDVMIWKVNLSRSHVKMLFKESLWRNVLETWSEINFGSPTTKRQISMEIIWYNSFILVGGKPVIFHHWYNKGILTVADICNNNLELLNFNEFEEKWGNVSWLEFQSIKAGIPISWKQVLREPYMGEVKTGLYDSLISTSYSNISRRIYNCLIFDEKIIPKYADRWMKEEPDIEFDFTIYSNAFKNLYQCTKITKYRDFQYRMLLCKIVCNRDLWMWGIKDDPACSLCKRFCETPIHLFTECEIVKPIIKWFKTVCENNNIHIVLDNPLYFLFNYCGTPSYHITNFVMIFIKQYVYRCRCNGTIPNVTAMKNELEYLQKIEWFNSCRENQKKKHILRWSPIYPDLAKKN